jgi:predicted MFS family arabinose efflux permease
VTAATATAPRQPLSVRRPLVLLLAAACALTVANIYYTQPLLDAIGRELQVGAGTAGLAVTLGQLGYAAGLVLLVPLGDLLDRRRLVTVVLAVSAAALVLVAAAPSFGLLGAAIVVVGLTSVVAQIFVPFAADLAAEHDRGRVVGYVMTGLVLGTLLSRTTAGLVAELAGWRAMYLVAAVLTVGLAVLVNRALPHHPPTADQPYLRLLGSVWRLLAREPVLRLRALYGGLAFAALNVLWTPMAFLLARPPYRFGEAAIGAFALITIPLAFTTGRVGRLADRGHNVTPAPHRGAPRPAGRWLTGVYFALSLAGAGLAWLGAGQLWALAAGAVLVTFGTQSAHITNQATIYRLDPAARRVGAAERSQRRGGHSSRITTAYMTLFFAGGVAGSALSAAAYAHYGWSGVSGLLAVTALAGVVTWAAELHQIRRAARNCSAQ